MASNDQEFDGGGVSVANMSPAEIDAALAAMDDEAMAARPEAGQAAVASQPPADLQQLVDSCDAAPAKPTPPVTDPSTDSRHSDSATTDTEAALDNIDKDLAELETLLAQTAGDNTSVPESILQAPSQAPESAASESPPSRPADEAKASAQETAAGDAKDLEGDVSEMDLSALDAAMASRADTQATADEPSVDSSETGNGLDALDQPPGEFGESARPAAETSPPPPAEEADEAATRTFGSMLLAPLVIIDKPFAGLSLRTKTAIGMAGIATLLVAFFTLILGLIR